VAAARITPIDAAGRHDLAGPEAIAALNHDRPFLGSGSRLPCDQADHSLGFDSSLHECLQADEGLALRTRRARPRTRSAAAAIPGRQCTASARAGFRGAEPKTPGSE
jgi:hypothetical protein